MASIDLLAVLDDVVRVMRSMPGLNWKPVRVVSPPTTAHMRTLVALQGACAVQGLRGDGPIVIVEAIDAEFSNEPLPDDCEFVGATRADVAASLRDQNACSLRARVAAVIISSLMGQSRFIVSSKADGRGDVVNVGLVSCVAAMRANLVVMFQRTIGDPFDDALQLYAPLDRVSCARRGVPPGNHEMLFVDVRFKSGAIRRLYVELTPGQISGFTVDALKAVFWEPLAAYSEIHENPLYANGYTDRTDFPGWENYSVITERVCEVALSPRLRHVPVNKVNQLI